MKSILNRFGGYKSSIYKIHVPCMEICDTCYLYWKKMIYKHFYGGFKRKTAPSGRLYTQQR